MRLELFRGADLRDIARQAEVVLGPDAMVVRTRVLRVAGGTIVEAVAAPAAEVERFKRRLRAAPLPPKDAPRARPYVVALVGPTGVGKTTTAAKLALSPVAFGDRRVGLLTLDTFRVGAVEQLRHYADITHLPLQVVYEAAEVEKAMRRLSHCDAVIVDTPGRGPAAKELNARWREVLQAVRPDETHLVVSATTRSDLALALRMIYRDDVAPEGAATHTLLAKLDEVPGDSGVAELAARLDLPARWVTDGQEVPGNLHAAGPRIMGALGFSTDPVRAGAA
jgi:flagellar biosynthesis protein FlhF